MRCLHNQRANEAAAAKEVEANPLLEVVTCSGYGKNGSLCVLQRAVQPVVLSSFPLPGTRDVFAVRGAAPTRASDVAATTEELYGPAPGATETYHKFLLVSQESSTLVLECGDELSQLTQTDFFTSRPTIFAASVLNDRRILQVFETGVRLLDGGAGAIPGGARAGGRGFGTRANAVSVRLRACATLGRGWAHPPDGRSVQELSMEGASTVVTCSLAGAYLLLQFADGDVALAVLDADSATLALSDVPPQVQGSVAAGSLYEDAGRFLLSRAEGALRQRGGGRQHANSAR